MLQLVHDKVQGLVVWIVAIVITIPLILWEVQSYLQQGTNTPVAKVNGKKITQEQCQLAYEQAKYNMLLRFGSAFSLDQKMQTIIKQQVLEQLIQQQILAHAQTAMGLEIPKKELLMMIRNMPELQINGTFSPEKYQQVITRAYHTEQNFLNQLEFHVLNTQLKRSIVKSAFVLPNEIDFLTKIARQERNFGYFTITAQSFMPQITSSDEACSKYYDQHQQEFLTPEQVSIQYIELTADDLTIPQPSTQQLQELYQEHLGSFSAPTKWQVTKILVTVAPKAETQAVANAHKKIKEIVNSLHNNKELDAEDKTIKITTAWITQNKLPEDMVTHPEINQVSKPFRTADGYTLVKILAQQPGQPIPYTEVASKVAASYKHQHSMQAFTEGYDKLSDLVYTHPDSLEPAAKELDLTIKTTDLVTRNSNHSGILANPKVAKVAFSDAITKQNYNSNLIEVAPGKVVVLRIKDYIPEKLQPFPQVKAAIFEKLRLQKAKTKAHDLAQKILAAIQSGTSIEQLAKQHKLTWQAVKGAKYNQAGKGKQHEAAFTLKQPSPKYISASLIELPNDKGYAVVRLDKVYEATPNNKEKELENMQKILPLLFGQTDYQNLVTSLTTAAKIEHLTNKKDTH